MICIRGLRRGASVLREHAEDLSWVGISCDPLIPAGFIRSMKRDDHSRYKPLFRQAFAEETVDACAGYFRQEACKAVDDLRVEVTRDPGRSVDPRVMAGLVTVRSYARLFLGVLSETEHCAFVERMLLEPGPLYLQRFHGPDELRDPAMALTEIVRSKSRDVADPEVANSFLGNLLRAEPQALDDPNVLLNLVFLLAASSRDVTGLLHWIVKMLGDNPIWIARVRLDTGDLDRRIVMETLRLAQSEYIARRVLRPFEIDGYRVPQDARLRICVNESHRDPAVFEAPETFDPDRFSRRRYTSAEYAPFGMLEHSCLGVPTTMYLPEPSFANTANTTGSSATTPNRSTTGFTGRQVVDCASPCSDP